MVNVLKHATYRSPIEPTWTVTKQAPVRYLTQFNGNIV